MTGWLTFLRLCTFAAYLSATIRHELRFDGWLGMLAHSGDVLLFAFNWWLMGKVGRWIEALPSLTPYARLNQERDEV